MFLSDPTAHHCLYGAACNWVQYKHTHMDHLVFCFITTIQHKSHASQRHITHCCQQHMQELVLLFVVVFMLNVLRTN